MIGLGENRSKKIYAGDVEASSIYIGEKLVYPQQPTLRLKFDTTGTVTNSIHLPLISQGTKNIWVEYEGETIKRTTDYQDNEVVFPDSEGEKEIFIYGTLEGFNFYFGDQTDRNRLLEFEIINSNKFDFIEFNSTFFLCVNASTISGIPQLIGDCTYFFYRCEKLTSGIENIDTSLMTVAQGIFYRAFGMTADITSWDVSNCEYFGSFFNGAQSFNQDISHWDVSKAIDMDNMFNNQSSRPGTFNQDLSSWCVPNIPSKPFNFDKDQPNWVLPRPVWGTCP